MDNVMSFTRVISMLLLITVIKIKLNKNIIKKCISFIFILRDISFDIPYKISYKNTIHYISSDNSLKIYYDM